MTDLEKNQPDKAQGISRRTVTKAMAWAAPTIAVAATVPAAVASEGILELAGLGCKLPGNSNGLFKGYAFKLSANNNTNSEITLEITNATLDGAPLGQVAAVNLDGCIPATNPFTLEANTSYPNLVLATQLAPSSSNGLLEVTYTIDGGTTLITVTANVPAVPPINGNSCPSTTFTAAEKLCLASLVIVLWEPNTAYDVDDVVVLSTGEYLSCTVAGTSGGTEPTAPGSGLTVLDGTVTWLQISA
ncbi:hypothetical protein [Microbacterium thalassium]|uniref:Uncharacterized protein n=1 Tax=Microbacterium thalassium TaxID=362649 RepID=A0A7X0FMU3_9MICO|nr:hypothetical protein [Microbacterium thalassium]MBB6389887.1 hypothetical protein [Microbacterium thalassium]GLK24574.1 hypothetical protein GCM10017607_18920 [Microbacterium thalassium]